MTVAHSEFASVPIHACANTDNGNEAEDQPYLVDIRPAADPRLARTKWMRGKLFSNLPHEQQMALLLGSLPPALRCAPKLDWNLLPPRAVYSLLWGKASTSPERGGIALGTGVMALDGIHATDLHQVTYAPELVRSELQALFGIERLHQMTYEQWVAFGGRSEQMRRMNKTLARYSSLTATHLRGYLQELPPEQREVLEEFRLPELPARFLERYVPQSDAKRQARRRRKAQTDVLVPIAPVLLGLVLRRKAAAERLIAHHRALVARVETGEVTLPARLEYDDVMVGLDRGAIAVGDIEWISRPVHLAFTLWSPEAYVRRTRGDRYFTSVLAYRGKPNRRGRSVYRADLPDNYLLVADAETDDDALWFLPLVRDKRRRSRRSGYSDVGGVFCFETPISKWLSVRPELQGFEPEAVYRGILYGTALAVLALTSGARLAELAQVSADRFLPPRPYPIVRDGKPTGVLDVIYLQDLLPKGAVHESERQPYNVSGAIRLLREIGTALVGRHGQIPKAAPRGNKAAYLEPERYFFQWHQMVIPPATINGLLRLIFAGLDLHDTTGRAFNITSHILRHVGQTLARYRYQVPLEVIAALGLHHRLDDGRPSAASEYYTLQPEQERLLAQQRTIDRLVDDGRALVPVDPVDEERRLQEAMERSDELTRDAYETWHAYHPVVFGHCGHSGLCVRGRERVLCLGCPFLVPRPEYRWRAERYAQDYAVMAQRLRTEGNMGEAREYQHLASKCMDLAHLMLRLEEAETDVGWRPLYRELPEGRSANAGCDHEEVEGEAR